MNHEQNIARRIVFGSKESRALSQPVVKLAITSVALGIAIMIIAVMVVRGFQNEISNKAVGFGMHIRISNFDRNNSFEEEPFDSNQPFVNKIAADPAVKSISSFATKAGIVKTKEEIQGIVLKGVDKDFDNSFFSNKIISGKFFNPADSSQANDVIISIKLASLLKLKLNDNLSVYFIQQPPRVRKLKITGIYETGLEEFDKTFAICNINILRKLNDWNANDVGGFEVTLHSIKNLDKVSTKIYNETGFHFKTETIRELYPQIFNWLDLLNMNVVIIIILMIAVAGINMISTLLILILENTRLIGIMKAMGASNASMRKIFILVAAYIIGIGILTGNAVAFLLCTLQNKFGWITLDQQSYYLDKVPVDFSLPQVLLLNIGAIVICIAMMLLPAMLVTRISPVKAIRFD